MANINNQDLMYPRLLRRIRAVLIDEVVLLAALIVWWFTIGVVEAWSPVAKIGSLFLVFLTIDPVLVAYTGGTVGHHLMGLKVRDARRDSKVNLLVATARGFLRYFLGALSLVFIILTRRHQALHDLWTQTTVVLNSPESYSNREKFTERPRAPS